MMRSERFAGDEQAARLTEVERLAKELSGRPVVGRFGYRSLIADIDLLMDDVVRNEPHNPLGIPLIAPIEECVVDCYFHRGALEPLVNSRTGIPYRAIQSFERLLDHLEKARRVDLIERLWIAVARKSRAEFFYQLPARKYGVQDRVDQHKGYAVEAYGHAIDWLMRIGSTDAARKMTEERDALLEERFPELPPVSDLRKIDEAVFWELIRRSHSTIASEQVALIGELIKSFKCAEIKRFASIYCRQMKHLYHWNVWALGYAARGGCSDDAFIDFRTWLILQGDPQLLKRAIDDPAAAGARVPKDPDCPGGSLLAVIEEAYLARCGTVATLAQIDLAKPKGKEWSEEAFEATFPRLVRLYAR